MADLPSTTCIPCRGEGTLISNLGGETKKVPCPWCEGSGERRPGIDAQAAWPQDGAASAPADADKAGEADQAPAEAPVDAVA
jgi:DnaJ-class molecular chaperone